MNNQYRLALITGGSSGIGLALAKALSREGVSVCLLARDKEKLTRAEFDVKQVMKGEPKQYIDTISCDITNYDALAAVLDDWIDDHGVPDLVINSAGITYPGYFQELDVEIFHRLMNVNYFGTLHILKYLIPKMITKAKGTVVNISSQAGFVGVFGYSGYGASKYAVRGFSDVLRAEMKPLGIQVSIVFPPDTQTPQLDFEEPLKPPETKAIAGSAKVLNADHVANTIVRDVRRGKYVIIPGIEGKLFYRLVNLLGNLTYPVMDWLVRRAQKKKKNI
ncbi:MAG: SDR family oxidoreductase [Chloroflexota bacterium]|nr:SDR family oxidoreductase [Chloroflexota bacterium]